jgi:subtilisin-like proprotein convertase family protein
MSFKKGDYIVCLNTPEKDFHFPKNFIFKQIRNHDYLSVELDNNQQVNGWSSVDFYGERSFGKWRFATEQEIQEYDRIGKPYDVTTLIPKDINYEIY